MDSEDSHYSFIRDGIDFIDKESLMLEKLIRAHFENAVQKMPDSRNGIKINEAFQKCFGALIAAIRNGAKEAHIADLKLECRRIAEQLKS